jgi:hypothetical protein
VSSQKLSLRVATTLSSIRNQARGLEPALYAAFLDLLRAELAREIARVDEPDEEDFSRFKAKLEEDNP